MAFKVIGKSEKRYDGLAHVIGETKYVDDIFIPGTLMVKVLRSPVDKGKVRHLDISSAESFPGVAGIITPEDVPNKYQDQPVLASSIRYKGEPIVAVAAVDEDTALEAISKIKVDIEEEEAVFDPLEAMKAGAPKVRPEGNLYMYGKYPCRRVVFGNIEAGFKEADYIIEGEYFHPTLEHAPIEPWASLAVPGADGRLTVYSMCQSLHLTLGWLADVLHMESDDIRFIKWAWRTRQRGSTSLSDLKYIGGIIGGSFGAKWDIQADHIPAILALKIGRPVKWRWTREEDLQYSIYRGAWHVKIKDGVKKDGHIVARQIRSIRDAGAYTTFNAYVVEKHCWVASGPYFIPNVHVEGYCVYTNKPPAGAMRGFGITPRTFAIEVQMNRIASQIGIDPWELRFINAYHEGDQTPTRRDLDSVYLIETMQALAKKAGVKLPDRLMSMTSAERGNK
jgi:CO/xanthine dehydrogenase Mo-binding subunit